MLHSLATYYPQHPDKLPEFANGNVLSFRSYSGCLVSLMVLDLICGGLLSMDIYPSAFICSLRFSPPIGINSMDERIKFIDRITLPLIVHACATCAIQRCIMAVA